MHLEKTARLRRPLMKLSTILDSGHPDGLLSHNSSQLLEREHGGLEYAFVTDSLWRLWIFEVEFQECLNLKDELQIFLESPCMLFSNKVIRTRAIHPPHLHCFDDRNCNLDWIWTRMQPAHLIICTGSQQRSSELNVRKTS